MELGAAVQGNVSLANKNSIQQVSGQQVKDFLHAVLLLLINSGILPF
jgi:hypothetical protein